MSIPSVTRAFSLNAIIAEKEEASSLIHAAVKASSSSHKIDFEEDTLIHECILTEHDVACVGDLLVHQVPPLIVTMLEEKEEDEVSLPRCPSPHG